MLFSKKIYLPPKSKAIFSIFAPKIQGNFVELISEILKEFISTPKIQGNFALASWYLNFLKKYISPPKIQGNFVSLISANFKEFIFTPKIQGNFELADIWIFKKIISTPKIQGYFFLFSHTPKFKAMLCNNTSEGGFAPLQIIGPYPQNLRQILGRQK